MIAIKSLIIQNFIYNKKQKFAIIDTNNDK